MCVRTPHAESLPAPECHYVWISHLLGRVRAQERTHWVLQYDYRLMLSRLKECVGCTPF